MGDEPENMTAVCTVCGVEFIQENCVVLRVCWMCESINAKAVKIRKLPMEPKVRALKNSNDRAHPGSNFTSVTWT